MTGLGSSRFSLLPISALISEALSFFKDSVSKSLAIFELLFPKSLVKTVGIFPLEFNLIGSMLTKFSG
jgi:hypothetical protein